MAQQTNPEQVKTLTKGLLAIALIGAVFVVGVSYAVKLIVLPTPEETRIVLTAPKCEGNFEEYKKLVEKGQSLTLTRNQYSYAINGNFIGDKVVIARRGGELACGYLFAQAKKGSVALDQKYDSIYINPQGLGGHILRSRSISIQDDSENLTKVLLPLSSVPYLPRIPYNPEAQNFEITNWIKLINATSRIEFLIGLSTTNPAGIIDEITIAYKCWNPITGEETNDCQLSLEN